MSGESYLVGAGTLVAIIGATGLTARRLRAHFFPGWSGALGLLAASVIGIAVLVTLAEVVGTVGEFRRAPLVLAALVACVAVGFCGSGSCEPSRTRRPPSAAVIVVLLVAITPWLARTLGALRTGVLSYDSLNYHLPFAARYVQSGHVPALVFTFPGLETAFDPANSELIHGVGILALGRDTLSPLLNLGWFGLGLLAAWCVGRNRNVAPPTLAAVVPLLASPQFVAFLAGRATNDIASIALFLAAIALLLNGEDSRHATAGGGLGGAALLFLGALLGRRRGSAIRERPSSRAGRARRVGSPRLGRPDRDRRHRNRVSDLRYGRSNHVQYVGHKGAHGAFDRVESCQEWRQLRNAGDYDFVVVSPSAQRASEPVEARWTRADSAAAVVLHVGTASVFRVSGTFGTGGCE